MAVLITMLPLEASTAQPLASSTASAPEIHIESCSVDIRKLRDRAGRRGYVFKSISAFGDGVCMFDQTDLSFVVSATAQNDAVCEFELFTPPIGKQFNALRIGIKAGAGSAIRFIQRSPDQGKGFTFSLDAGKGETRQFRTIAIDVPPVDNACSDHILQGAVP